MHLFQTPAGTGRVLRAFVLAAIVVALQLGHSSDTAARQAEWVAHTSFREVNDLIVSGQDVWVATRGGAFSYNRDSGEIRRYTTVEDLTSVDVRAISFDPERNYVWLGYGSGVLDRIDLESGEVRAFRDIARATQFTSRGINRIKVHGDSLLVATDFGLVVFDAVRAEVRDSYTRLGTLPAAMPVRDVLVAPIPSGEQGLWLAADGGIAYASRDHPNLREPGAWTVDNEGLPSTMALSLAYANGTYYAGTQVDISIRGEDGIWRRTFVSGGSVYRLRASGGRMIGIDDFFLIALDEDGTHQRVGISGRINPRSLDVTEDGRLWVGDRVEGVAVVSGPPFAEQTIEPVQVIIPDGPQHHLFLDFDFDDEGNLWAAGAQGSGTGFYHFKDNTWTSYTARTQPALEGLSSFWRIHVDRQGNVWTGSAGAAAARLSPSGEITTFNRNNSTLTPVPGDQAFTIVRGIDSDHEGNVWITNQFSTPHLNVVRPDGTWMGLPEPRPAGLPGNALYDRIFIDSNNFKWITLMQGMMVLDTGGNLESSANWRMRYYGNVGSGGRGLPGPIVRSIVEDRSGRIWIGTSRGIAFFFAPSFVFSDDPNAFEPQWPISDGAFFLRDLNVNYLAPDPAERLWIGSSTGAWLIRPTGDGYEIVQHFTAANSPLLSDNVVAIGVQETTGRVFFATDQGLVSWQGDATAPVAQRGNLFVYPNPLRLGEGGAVRVTIEGLVEATDLRIMTAAGEVVAAMETRGGRAQWDGNDLTGRPVPSGVYLVVAVGQNGEGAAYGKVAVIR